MVTYYLLVLVRLQAASSSELYRGSKVLFVAIKGIVIACVQVIGAYQLPLWSRMVTHQPT